MQDIEKISKDTDLKPLTNIDDIIKSSDFLLTFRQFLNQNNIKEANRIISFFQMYQNNSISYIPESEKLFVYSFFQNLQPINENIDFFLSLKNYVLNQLFSGGELIESIRTRIYNTISASSKADLLLGKKEIEKAKLFDLGDIGEVKNIYPQLGLVIGTKGYSLIDKNFNFIASSGDLAIGEFDFFDRKKYGLNEFVVGVYGYFIIDKKNSLPQFVSGNLGIGELLMYKDYDAENIFRYFGYILGTLGIVKVNFKTGEIEGKLSYNDFFDLDNYNDIEEIFDRYFEENNLYFYYKNFNDLKYKKGEEIAIQEAKEKFLDPYAKMYAELRKELGREPMFEDIIDKKEVFDFVWNNIDIDEERVVKLFNKYIEFYSLKYDILTDGLESVKDKIKKDLALTKILEEQSRDSINNILVFQDGDSKKIFASKVESLYFGNNLWLLQGKDKVVLIEFNGEETKVLLKDIIAFDSEEKFLTKNGILHIYDEKYYQFQRDFTQNSFLANRGNRDFILTNEKITEINLGEVEFYSGGLDYFVVKNNGKYKVIFVGNDNKIYEELEFIDYFENTENFVYNKKGIFYLFHHGFNFSFEKIISFKKIIDSIGKEFKLEDIERFLSHDREIIIKFKNEDEIIISLSLGEDDKGIVFNVKNIHFEQKSVLNEFFDIYEEEDEGREWSF